MKTEKSYSKPYTKEYADIYNNLYLLDETHYQHTKFEINIIENLLQNKTNWLDVACGTGYHLNTVVSDVEKHGIDRSKDMINYAKKTTNKNIKYLVGDIKKIKHNTLYDLVTFLWIGYVHSKSVDDAVNSLYCSSNRVNKEGNFLLTFCDPMYLFETFEDRQNFLNRGDMTFDGVVWSYKDDVNKLEYKNLVAPNRFKIIEKILPDYTEVVEMVYPQENNMYWKKSALLFVNKRK